MKHETALQVSSGQMFLFYYLKQALKNAYVVYFEARSPMSKQ